MEDKNALLEVGLKVTKARIGVLEVLRKTKNPLDAQSVLSSLIKKDIDADLATVYRIIDAFISVRLIQRIDIGDGKYRYEILDEANHHHHLICENCGSLSDIEFEDDLSNIESEIWKEKMFKVTRHSLEFYGVCKKCSK